MQQREREESEKTHNLEGMPPSDFSDVDDKDLRNRNRGAVLANIYERYTETNAKGQVYLTAKNLATCTREMDKYLEGMSRRDRQNAREAMMRHLHNRGFNAKA